MPYIKQENREKYQEIINNTISTLTFFSVNKKVKDFDIGDLNYVISSVIWQLFDQNPKYRTANDLVGVLECIKQEFIRRKVNIYEDSKIKENGDINI